MKPKTPWFIAITLMPLMICIFSGGDRCAHAQANMDMRWYDIREMGVEGRGWSETKHFYDRLPARAEGKVRAPVWELSENSAGICVRFLTDATSIAARWTLRSHELALPHMPATGVSGVDLYVKDDDSSRWHWLANGRPEQFPTNEKILISNLRPGKREYLLYLPLYNGVKSVEIGLPSKATITKAPPYPPQNSKPILFYGTSIVQGGVASRPGMAYPAILGRWLNRPAINLGFSGQGVMEPEVAALLSELDPAIYVIDCLPNLLAPEVAARTEKLVHIIRQSKPLTPIVLVESISYQDGVLEESRARRYKESNAALFAAYKRLVSSGVKNIEYVKGDKLLGDDGEATVDGTHPTDLGFLRMAQTLEPVLRKALKDQH